MDWKWMARELRMDERMMAQGLEFLSVLEAQMARADWELMASTAQAVMADWGLMAQDLEFLLDLIARAEAGEAKDWEAKAGELLKVGWELEAGREAEAGCPGIVTELVSEPGVLEVIDEPPLVTDVKLDIRLVSDVDKEPAGEETDELGWLTLVPDRVGLTSVELGSTELLVGILVAGGLLGGKGTEITTGVLLGLGRGTELDKVVSVDQALVVWLDFVGDRLELELCPGGSTIVSVDVQVLDGWLDLVVGRLKLEPWPGGRTTVVVVSEGSAPELAEDGALLLRPLVLEAIELPKGVEGDAGDVGMPDEDVSVGGKILKVGVVYVLKAGVEWVLKVGWVAYELDPGLALEGRVDSVVEESAAEAMLDSGYEVNDTSVLGE
ncbi:hypothetical protein LA080_004335 [Diaporthe eres]|nr:hypothetical protein LA080_004335 [Diaporthe eres]